MYTFLSLTEDSVNASDDNIISPSKSVTQDFGIERHGFQLPPPFYPANSPERTRETTREVEIGEDLPYKARSIPGSSERSIVFGGSRDSSPNFLPALSSAFTQPTPPSDMGSSPTQSNYHDYGNENKGSVVIPPLAFVPAQYNTPGTQEVYMPFRYSHDINPTTYYDQIPFVSQPNQPPFTPSATPFRTMSTQWSEPLEKPSADVQNGFAPYDPMVGADQREVPPTSYLEALTSHLLQQFNDPEYADCHLEVQTRDQSVNLMLHALLIGRSLTLRALIASATSRDHSGRFVLYLPLSDNFVTIPAIISAILVCYGKPPSDIMSSSMPDMFASESSVDRYQHDIKKPLRLMDSALSYLAAGCILKMPEVSLRGIEAVGECFTLKTVEKALSFALDGFLDSECHTFFDDGEREIEEHDLSTVQYGRYAPYSTHMLEATLKYIITCFPKSFILDVWAPSLLSIYRFPAVEDVSRDRPFTKSMLTAIKFGDFPVSAEDQQSQEDSILSSILLSVPYFVAKYILQHLEKSITQSILRPLVEVRERRRLDVIRNRIDTVSRGEFNTWKEARWEEIVMGTEPDLQLSRRWSQSQS